MDPLEAFGIRNLFGFGGQPSQPAIAPAAQMDPYGLTQVSRATAPVLAPVRIGPASAPLAPAPFPRVPMRAPQAPQPVAPQPRNVVPFRATNPAQPETSPRTDAQVPNIPIDKLVQLQRHAESSGDYTAANPHSTASGAYQYTDGTWNGYGGYKRAAYAPREVQDRRFAEDIAARMRQYNGDVFKAIASHYLPAAANNPAIWTEPYNIRGKNGKVTRVPPVANYVRHVLKGTQFGKQFDDYLASH